MAGKYERPSRGDLLEANYRSRGRVSRYRDVVSRVSGDVAELRGGPEVDLGDLAFRRGSGEHELLATRVVVPASQVRRPGVAPGDTVKVKSGSSAYMVEDVEDGLVELEDGRVVPVTHIGAFDEDVDDYDPLSLPGQDEWWLGR